MSIWTVLDVGRCPDMQNLPTGIQSRSQVNANPHFCFICSTVALGPESRFTESLLHVFAGKGTIRSIGWGLPGGLARAWRSLNLNPIGAKGQAEKKMLNSILLKF